MSSFQLEIITPEKVAYTDDVEMVTVTSSDGEIGILPKHTPLFTRLVQGEVKIKKQGEEIFLAIGGGFMQVSPQKTVILVTEAFHASEINENEVMMAKKRAEEALAQKPTGEALISAQSMFKRSMIAMKLLNKKRHGNQRSNMNIS